MDKTDPPAKVASNDQLGHTLRPCPFCGSDARMSGLKPNAWRVYCHGCEATRGPFESERKALYFWNKRAVGAEPMDSLDIEELFDQAAGADDETHVRFARLIEQHHGIRGA